jgi:enolase
MSNARIAAITPRRIWDSRGRPTVEVDVRLAGGAFGRGVAPAGASRGSREAIELRDGGSALGGYGVEQAIRGLRDEIAPALVGRDATDQGAIDRRLIELDGTAQKQRLGGNALIAVSLAVLQAAASAAGEPLWRHLAGGRPARLPMPEIQIFGGGAHAGRRIDIQDLMVVPVGAADFADALAMVAEVYRAAGTLMAERGKLRGVADEGGFWPEFATNEEALETLLRAIERAGFRPGEQVAISLDIAASEFGSQGRYRFGLERRELDSAQMIDLLGDWIARFPIVAIEDPLAEDDAEGMRAFTARLGERVQVIGDDYLVTDAALIAAAAAAGACNAALIKPNQAGTVSETVAAIEAARRGGMATIISARSGETEDATLAHLAVGWDCGQLKVGSFARSERMAKWNEMLRIAEQAGAQARFATWSHADRKPADMAR